jgi:hypothetical protein
MKNTSQSPGAPDCERPWRADPVRGRCESVFRRAILQSRGGRNALGRGIAGPALTCWGDSLTLLYRKPARAVRSLVSGECLR